MGSAKTLQQASCHHGLQVDLAVREKPRDGASCHHRLRQDLVVTEEARKWCILSPLAQTRPRGDIKDQKVVHAVKMGCDKSAW